MPGRTAREAVQNYIAPLQQALSCVSQAVFRPTGYKPAGTVHMLSSEQMPCSLPKTDLRFDIAQWFYIIEDPQVGPWRVTTAGYKYTIETDDGDEVLGYHWHPDSPSSFKEPHLHLGVGAQIGRAELEDSKAHLPTGRVAMEDFIQLLIVVFGATPKTNWRSILKTTAERFWKQATWVSNPQKKL